MKIPYSDRYEEPDSEPIARRLEAPRWSVILVLILLPLVCGVVVLARHAPRDWSLHWVAAHSLLTSNGTSQYDAVETVRGWDVLWTGGQGMHLSSFDRTGKRLAPDTAIPGTPQSLALGRVGSTDVAFWRQDYNGGSRLRAAIVTPGRPVREYTVASGSAVLEHPLAFTLNGAVDVVFSWQKPVFDVFLVRVRPDGTISAPVRLTHASGYAFLPHAVPDPRGGFDLAYFDQCCGAQAFHLEAAHYSATGRLLAPPRRLDTVYAILQSGSGGVAGGSVPNEWGFDFARDGTTDWVAWSSDDGIKSAHWRGDGAPVVDVALPGPTQLEIALALHGDQRELIWQQTGGTGNELATMPLAPDGTAAAAPDRVTFLPGEPAEPVGLTGANDAALLWEQGTGPNTTLIEESRYSPSTIGAPNLATRLGLGVTNTAGSVFLLLGGGIAIAALITAANILFILAIVVALLIAQRIIPDRNRWWVVTVALAVLFYLLLDPLNAPLPPLIAFSGLHGVSVLVAVVGMAIWVFLLTTTLLRRMDTTYRLAAMTIATVYFFAFLQALTVVQGQLGSI